MSITLPTEAEVEQLALAAFQVAHTDPRTGRAPQVGPRSFLGQQARALASLIGEILYGAKSADDDAVPSVYTDAQGVTRTRNSGLSLDDWAFVLGLPSNVAGTYGRKGAQAARGGGATAQGSTGTVIATGAGLTDLSGTVAVQVRTGLTINADPTLNGITIDATTAGEVGNLPVGAQLRWSSPPSGLAAIITLTTALSGGFEVESDVDLALRLVRRLQNFPKGGTASDYREWGESAEDGSGLLVGVVRNYVYKGREGHGSVTSVPVLGGSGRARDPDNDTPGKIAQIQAWIDALHIASDTAYVVRPRFVSGEELTIAATVVAAQDFDWDAGGSPPSVSSGASGSTSLVLAAPPPTGLTDAITNGDEPRIAINFSGSEIPFVSRVTAYSGSTLMLETPLPQLAAGGELVYEAGDATIPIASAILAYVNSVGPSRKSGYADPLDPWEDTVSVGRIAQVTLSARDADSGDLVAVWSPGVGNGVGVTIKVGSGSPSGDDFELYDNVPDQGPQLPECKAVVVRRAA